MEIILLYSLPNMYNSLKDAMLYGKANIIIIKVEALVNLSRNEDPSRERIPNKGMLKP